MMISLQNYVKLVKIYNATYNEKQQCLLHSGNPKLNKDVGIDFDFVTLHITIK